MSKEAHNLCAACNGFGDIIRMEYVALNDLNLITSNGYFFWRTGQ